MAEKLTKQETCGDCAIIYSCEFNQSKDAEMEICACFAESCRGCRHDFGKFLGEPQEVGECRRLPRTWVQTPSGGGSWCFSVSMGRCGEFSQPIGLQIHSTPVDCGKEKETSKRTREFCIWLSSDGKACSSPKSFFARIGCPADGCACQETMEETPE